MNERQAIDACAALAQENRMRIVRALVTAGPNGMAAGTIGDAVGTSSSNLSFHLKQLEWAGLVESRREARSIIYSAAFPALAALIEFLTRDCCQGHPQVCNPDALAQTDCSQTKDPKHV